MENKITISELTAMLALATGTPGDLCENFLRELFQLIGACLESGETVRIKGLGTFKLTDVEARKSVDVNTGEQNEIPQHKKIVFIAAKELAAKVNAPFEMFEAVELADSLPLSSPSYSDTLESDESIEQSEERPDVPQNEIVSEGNDLPHETTDLDSEGNDLSPEATDLETIPIRHRPEKRTRFGWGFLTGFLSAVTFVALIAIIWFIVDLNKGSSNVAIISGADGPTAVFISKNAGSSSVASSKDSANLDTASVEVSESSDESVPTRPSDTTEAKPTYDTVSTTRYLTTMAKEHYGNFNLWPVIYEENQAILGHPDRIKPGTRVVVPPLSKYGIDPNSPSDIAKMKEKGKQIYARYK